MREVIFTDEEGRMWRSLLNDDDPDELAPFGIVYCPPDLSDFGWPPDFTTRVHNQLFHLGICSHRAAAARQQDIARAIRSAMRVDVKRIIDAFPAE